jgi:hypothetical protein
MGRETRIIYKKEGIQVPNSTSSSGNAFVLGLMALMVAVMCVTIQVITENIESRIIMASIWVIIAIAWFVQAARTRRAKENSLAEE